LLPQPVTNASNVAVKATPKTNLDATRTVCAAGRKGLRLGRDCVFSAASILAKCKTTPTMVPVLTMLKA
jgi:hypothetical protein